MPAPSETEILKGLLDALNENSEFNKRQNFYRKVLLASLILFGLSTVITYNFGFLQEKSRLLLSLMSGLSLAGFAFIQQSKAQVNLLRPYIDINSIEKRINEIES